MKWAGGLVIVVNGVDRHFTRAKRAGVEILEEPNDMEYGHRRYRASDCEGHEWSFTQELDVRRPRSKRRASWQ